jgi:formylglycine-generating enzyme required for sulfatase activity
MGEAHQTMPDDPSRAHAPGSDSHGRFLAVPPAAFDEYRLLHSLGEATVGWVYLAQDTLLDRLVAMKFVRALGGKSMDHFLMEARAAARIQHPNVAALYRVGDVDDGAYLISEYVRGRRLDALERPVGWPRLLEIACDLTRGLAAAHRRSVLHCDLNPSNAVVTDEGQIKIVDFGLARLMNAAAGEGYPERPLVGAPDYIPPESWLGEELTVRSDLYSLGVMLYELATGRRPFRNVPPHLIGHVATEREAPALSGVAPGVDARFSAAIERCVRKDPRERYATADELLDDLERLRPGRRLPVPDGNPYRGLQAFQPEHRAFFFGRSRDCLTLVERMRTEAFVLVAGDSGVGKSSLCLAGLVPAVNEGELGGRTWRIVRLVPGRRPLAALASALAPQDAESAEKMLRDQPAAFARKLRRDLPEDEGLILFVDQLEELVTLGKAEAAAVAFALAELAAGYDGIRLLATARNDFLGPLASLPCLGELIPRALYLLRGLSEDELCEAIAGPANMKGVRFESEALVRSLADATASAQGGLPLLQFMLADVWETRDREGCLIASAGIDAVGGVGGALSRHADGVLSGLLPQEREAARRILLRLATPERTRSRHVRGELTSGEGAAESALEALVRGRLLVVRDGNSIELAHEALLTAWATLAHWIEEQSGQEAVRQRVEVAAEEWTRSGGERETLWGTRRLTEARVLDRRLLSPAARKFLLECGRTVRAALWRRRAIPIVALAVLATVFLVWRMARRREVDRDVAQRLAAAVTALGQARVGEAAFVAARLDSFREFDAGRKAKGEEVWQLALGLGARSGLAFAAAAEKFEDALVVGGNREDVRDAVADFLAARAAHEQRRSEREELLKRLRLYDSSGNRLRAFRAEARLALATKPSGASVRIAPVVESEGSRRPGPIRDLGMTPLRVDHLEPGTYQLYIVGDGRPAIELPLQLEPGEERQLDLDIPAVGTVPDGFAYVPPGRAFFGSSADEGVRQFFNTAPLHPIETRAFLIARRETTWADYIDYLSALPAAEQKRRTPHVGGTALTGQLDLKKAGESWQLAIENGSRMQVLRKGDKLRLPREKRAEQDWLRLPVAGVSFRDARAYAAWLARTARVPGARLCSEMEWERAARGADDREFPNGDALRPADANFDATYGKKPSAFGPDEVGSHPGSRSPFGVDDLAGNVWEWVESSLVPGEAVARGGSAYATRDTCRSVNRELPEPAFRANVLGIRVCASLPSEPSRKGDGR